MRASCFDDVLRVVFVGRTVEEHKWTLTAPADGVLPAFVDHRSRDLVAVVASHRPDVVVVFGPHRLGRGVAAALPAATIACLTEPLHVPWTEDGSPWSSGEIVDARAGEPLNVRTARFDMAEYDRLIVSDPRVWRTLSSLTVWRCSPLPVDDALYRAGKPLTPDSRAVFIGESSVWREAYLVGAKHHYDLRHYAFGLAGERLAHVLTETSIGVVMAAGPWTTFEAAAALHLASGHLLLAGPLVPSRGLEAGLDHLTFREPEELLHLLFELRIRPAAFEQVRLRGRVRAEEFRASRIWPRILRDCLLDLDAFGSERRAAA